MQTTLENASILPRLMLIADGFTKPAAAHRVQEAARAGAMWIQLRDHRAARADFAAAARSLASTLRAENENVHIVINTHVEVAKSLDAGVHLGRRGPPVRRTRKQHSDALIGFSAHDLQEARTAAAEGADYVSFSPVFPTPSKPDHPGAGLEALQMNCERAPAPLLALGGVTPERVAPCLDAGAHGVAVLSGIMHAHDPAQAVQRYLQALDV